MMMEVMMMMMMLPYDDGEEDNSEKILAEDFSHSDGEHQRTNKGEQTE